MQSTGIPERNRLTQSLLGGKVQVGLWQLYKILKKNEDLKARRHPMFEKNRFMKFLAWFLIIYYAAILLLMGVMMPTAMKGAYNGVAAFHVLDGGLIYFILTDFWLRFVLQETPAQQAKPYSLLPIRRSFLMNVYLAHAGLSLGNMFWAFFLVPFGAIAIWPLMGFWAFLSWLIGWWLLFIANGYAYLFVRALCMKHIAWALLPAAIHAGLLALMFVPEKNLLDMPCTEFMYAFAKILLWPYLVAFVLIAFFYLINFWLQTKMVYNEVAQKEEVEMKHTTQMNFLNRYGAMGEYLKMEIKLRMRNKQVRMGFIIALCAMLFFSAMLYFTDVYDGTFMKSFICLYDYVLLGVMTLPTIMCYEGNYIDGLMSRRQSIYDLLRAKFYFNSISILIPLLFILPLVFIGKISLWMNLGYLFFTAGVLYPCFFQMAVYNKDTLPLNQKITAKQANTMQQIVTLVAMFLPILIEKIAILILGNPGGYFALIAMGLVGLATHKIWLRNIYTRMMQRRYVNMEGFRATRNF